jgi:hypothetical protein
VGNFDFEARAFLGFDVVLARIGLEMDERYDMKSMNYSAIRRSLRAPLKDLNRVVVAPGNWLGWLCKLLGHHWRNIHWNDAATLWRVRCTLCKKTEERSWK